MHRPTTREPASDIAGGLSNRGIALKWRPRFDAGIVAAPAGGARRRQTGRQRKSKHLGNGRR